MKKSLLIIMVLFLVVACKKKIDVVGTWKTSEGNQFIFNDDGTCSKVADYTIVDCTYLVKSGVIDIEFEDVKESGQITSRELVIGSEVYKK